MSWYFDSTAWHEFHPTNGTGKAWCGAKPGKNIDGAHDRPRGDNGEMPTCEACAYESEREEREAREKAIQAERDRMEQEEMDALNAAHARDLEAAAEREIAEEAERDAARTLELATHNQTLDAPEHVHESEHHEDTPEGSI